MKIEIDQSGKIEDTNKNTIIAFSNKIFRSILIKAKDKREIQDMFRKIGKPRMYIYRTFTELIYLLIRNDLNKIKEIVIDKEYPEKEALIKNLLLQRIKGKKSDFLAENISFTGIGKKSKAHLLGYLVYKNRRKADLEIVSKEILKFIIK